MPRGSKPGERRGGRKKGTPNRITGEVREVLRAGVEGTADEVIAAIRMALSDDPVSGVRAWAAVAEFVLPKLGRQEFVGDAGGPVKIIKVDMDD